MKNILYESFFIPKKINEKIAHLVKVSDILSIFCEIIDGDGNFLRNRSMRNIVELPTQFSRIAMTY